MDSADWGKNTGESEKICAVKIISKKKVLLAK
jgi:hypothetical protein